MTSEENQTFYRKVLKIAIPITLAQLMNSLLSVIDTFMVSDLGDYPLAAVAIGSNFGFFLIMVMFGFLSGLGIYLAQYWGSKEIDKIHRVFILTLIIAVSIAGIFFIVVHFFPQFIISLYNNGDNLVAKAAIESYGVKYLSIVSFAYITMSISFSIQMLMRSVQKVIFPQIISVLTVLTNTGLNYLLIQGRFGFPAMGVEGAATATVISSSLGMIVLISYMIFSNFEVFKVKFSEYKNISREFISMIAKKALPVAINETIWGLGMSAYLMAIGFISAGAIETVQISNQIMGLFWVFNAGIATACAIMLGNKLGENDIELAKKWGKKFTKLSLIAGLIMGVSLFSLSGVVASAFENVSGHVQHDIRITLMIFSFYVPVKFVNALQIIGTLRAGGDTKYAMFSEMFPLWLIGVPLAFILSIFTDLPVYIIMGLVNIEELVKLGLVLRRFFSYKWAQNLTEQ